MGPGYFILAVMGCADGGMMCEDIARRETLYRSEAACIAASDTALEAASNAPYPLLMTECRQASPQLAERVRRTNG